MTYEFYETDRLIIRPWKDDDLDALYSLGNDEEVTRFLDKSQYTLENS